MNEDGVGITIPHDNQQENTQVETPVTSNAAILSDPEPSFNESRLIYPPIVVVIHSTRRRTSSKTTRKFLISSTTPSQLQKHPMNKQNVAIGNYFSPSDS